MPIAMPAIRRRQGFTIVELLIVIVVIGILAAITIVAYNGIQTRAENSTTANGLAAYAKAFGLFAADNGSYPSTSVYPCLGSPTSGACGKIAGGACTSTGATTVNTAFDNAMTPYLGSTKPSISSQSIACGGDTQFRGAHVDANASDTKNLYIKSFFKGSGDCPSIGSLTLVTRTQDNQMVFCHYRMPTL